MPVILDPTKHFAVERDGLPRVADYDDGAQRVLYLDGALVRSMLANDWPPPLPADPTPAESAAAVARRKQARRDLEADAERLRLAIRAKLQSTVGVQVDDLLVDQLCALVAELLRERGALTADLRVRLVDEWGK